MTKTAAVYARTATHNAAALERQKATCRQFAHESDYVIIGEFAEMGIGQAASYPCGRRRLSTRPPTARPSCAQSRAA